MQTFPEIKLIIDTHIFVWLLEGDTALSNKSVRVLEKTIETSGEIGISAISLWEISMLESRGRIVLNQPCLHWINRGLQAPGIQLVPLTPEISVESCSFSGAFHGDPADRIISATARVLGVPLMTRDEKILAYAKSGHLKCLAA